MTDGRIIYVDVVATAVASDCYLEPYDEDSIYYWVSEGACGGDEGHCGPFGRVARDVLARVIFPNEPNEGKQLP